MQCTRIWRFYFYTDLVEIIFFGTHQHPEVDVSNKLTFQPYKDSLNEISKIVIFLTLRPVLSKTVIPNCLKFFLLTLAITLGA